MNPQRGEIWRANLDPVVGSEIEKTRPVLVLSLARAGRPTVRLCVPLTDWKANAALLYWCVTLSGSPKSGLRKLSLADVSQSRALDLQRFGTKLGEADDVEIESVAAALAKIIGYAP